MPKTGKKNTCFTRTHVTPGKSMESSEIKFDGRGEGKGKGRGGKRRGKKGKGQQSNYIMQQVL